MDSVTAGGVEVPVLGFGTARMDTDEKRYEVVSTALETGYRHIDTAQSYGSESAVGEAIADSGVARDDLFVTTKLSRENRAHDAVVESTHASLDRLDMEFVDLLLIHTPNDDVPHHETLDAMGELTEEGVVRNVGVSNFSVEQTNEATEFSDEPILTNQVEYNLTERKDDLLSFCIEREIVLTAYSPIAGGDALDDDTLVAVAERHDRTPAQVAIRWLLQQPMVVPVTMSSKPERVRSNFEVFDFELSDDDMSELFAVGGPPDDDLAAKLGL